MQTLSSLSLSDVAEWNFAGVVEYVKGIVSGLKGDLNNAAGTDTQIEGAIKFARGIAQLLGLIK